MARTLFFVEAFLFAALAVAFPIIASETAAAFILPAGISLLLPLACAMAVWPPRIVLAALASAFSSRKPGEDSTEYAAILRELGLFSRASAALGLLFAVTDACAHLSQPESREGLILIGVYLAAYAVINAQLWRILAAVVEGMDVGASSEDKAMEDEAFAKAHGLTPPEWQTARLIAGGASYKEAAYELGISIKTAKAHMGHVYEKTGAASNVALALILKESAATMTKVL